MHVKMKALGWLLHVLRSIGRKAKIKISQMLKLIFMSDYSEGYNLDHDERYNEWVQRFHPSSFAEPTGMYFSAPDRDLESHTDCDDLSKIVQVPPNDSADVCYLQKTSIVDKLLDDRKNEFKLPTLKTKKSSCVLTSEENLKIVREKETKKKKEEKKRKDVLYVKRKKRKRKDTITTETKCIQEGNLQQKKRYICINKS